MPPPTHANVFCQAVDSAEQMPANVFGEKLRAALRADNDRHRELMDRRAAEKRRNAPCTCRKSPGGSADAMAWARGCKSLKKKREAEGHVRERLLHVARVLRSRGPPA